LKQFVVFILNFKISGFFSLSSPLGVENWRICIVLLFHNS
jgi:hypothetical protein